MSLTAVVINLICSCKLLSETIIITVIDVNKQKYQKSELGQTKWETYNRRGTYDLGCNTVVING